MRCEEIILEQEYCAGPEQELYRFSIAIIAKSATRLSPFRMGEIEVQFPCMDVVVGNVRRVMLKGLGDTGQLLHIVVDVALFHTDEAAAMSEILGVPTVDIIGLDDTLNLVDPQITLEGSRYHAAT